MEAEEFTRCIEPRASSPPTPLSYLTLSPLYRWPLLDLIFRRDVFLVSKLLGVLNRSRKPKIPLNKKDHRQTEHAMTKNAALKSANVPPEKGLLVFV